MATEEDNKIEDMIFPVSLIMLADPLLSVCSCYAVRERFINGRILFARRRVGPQTRTPFPFRHCLEDKYFVERALTTRDVLVKTFGGNAED
jgi:hypothetical protein